MKNSNDLNVFMNREATRLSSRAVIAFWVVLALTGCESFVPAGTVDKGKSASGVTATGGVPSLTPPSTSLPGFGPGTMPPVATNPPVAVPALSCSYIVIPAVNSIPVGGSVTETASCANVPAGTWFRMIGTRDGVAFVNEATAFSGGVITATYVNDGTSIAGVWVRRAQLLNSSGVVIYDTDSRAITMVTSAPAPAPAVPQVFSANVNVPAYSKTSATAFDLAFTVYPDAADLGRTGRMYVFAKSPDGTRYWVLNGSGNNASNFMNGIATYNLSRQPWTPYEGDSQSDTLYSVAPPQLYSTKVILSVTGVDLAPLSGYTLYTGYGLSINDMISRNKISTGTVLP